MATPAPGQGGDQGRDEDLARPGGGLQALGLDDRQAEAVLADQAHVPDRDPDADRQGIAGGTGFPTTVVGRHLLLDPHRGGDGIRRPGKGRHHPIPGVLDDSAPVVEHRGAHQAVVALPEALGGLFAHPYAYPGRVNQVGEHHREGLDPIRSRTRRCHLRQWCPARCGPAMARRLSIAASLPRRTPKLGCRRRPTATVGLAGDSRGHAEQILPEAAFFNEPWKLPSQRRRAPSPVSAGAMTGPLNPWGGSERTTMVGDWVLGPAEGVGHLH